MFLYLPFIKNYATDNVFKLSVQLLCTLLSVSVIVYIYLISQDYNLEEEMATPSSILAWKIPCTKKSAGLQSMRLQSVGHN